MCVLVVAVLCWQGNPVLQGTHNAARRIVDGLTYVSDTVTDYSKKPTKVVTNWVTDRIAPPYWIPNAQISVSFTAVSCFVTFITLVDGLA